MKKITRAFVVCWLMIFACSFEMIPQTRDFRIWVQGKGYRSGASPW